LNFPLFVYRLVSPGPVQEAQTGKCKFYDAS
jgi:hypothetical protein